METNDFEKLELRKELIEGVYLYGFKTPSPIQMKGIKSINTRKDCLLQSQSGTGKTATFLLGILNQIEENNTLQALVLTPTRELSDQVYGVAKSVSRNTNIKIVKCLGGTHVGETIRQLKNANVVIGTIGRVNHMISEKKINLNTVKTIVLDEVDSMVQEGLNKSLLDIFDSTDNKQVVMISATLSRNVFNLEKRIMNNPIKVLLKKSEIAVELISQFYLDVEVEDYKFDVLMDLYSLISTSQAIIFCNTIRKVKWLEENLVKNNFEITSIHGKMTQKERNDVVKDFRDGKTRILLTTDLLARGIDIPKVNLVINFDIPISKETYIHRIGRCGRFGAKGVAITLVKMEDPTDVKLLNKMKQYYNMEINELPDDIENYI